MEALAEGLAALLVKVIPDAILDRIQKRRDADLVKVKADNAEIEAAELRRKEHDP